MLQPRVTTPRRTTGLELCRRALSSAHPQPGSLKPGRTAEIWLRPQLGPDPGSLLMSRALKYLTKRMFSAPFSSPFARRAANPGLCLELERWFWTQAVTALYGPDRFGIYRLR